MVFIFSHTFQLIRMKFDTVLKQCKLKLIDLLLLSDTESSDMTILLTTLKTTKSGMLLDCYEPIWFKLDMMIETTEFYTLIAVWATFKATVVW